MQQRTALKSNSNPLVKLSRAEIGVGWMVAQIADGQDPHVLRVCEMGLIPGTSVEILRKGRLGTPFLIRVNHIDLCLDEELAGQFLVQKVVSMLPGGDP